MDSQRGPGSLNDTPTADGLPSVERWDYSCLNRVRVAVDQTLRLEVYHAAWKHQECKINAKSATCEHLSLIL